MSILEYLVLNAIDRNVISMKYNGEKQPTSSNYSEQGKQKNRRVELLFTYEEFIVTDIFDEFKNEPQIFEIAINQKSTISGSEGTVITVPANSLVTKDGNSVTGKVQIVLNEYYSKSDMLMANLHTTSGNDLLESAGMIDIRSTQNGKELKLQTGAEITIQFKPNNDNTRMQIFNGLEHENGLDWEPQNTVEATERAYVEIQTILNDRLRLGKGKLINEADSAYIANDKQANDFILSSAALGWINCDRFYQFKNKTDLQAKIDTSFRAAVRLVFSDINSMMYGYLDKNQQINFPRVPIGKKATLVALSMVNNEPYYFMQEIIIESDQNINVELIKTSKAELKAELKKLN